MVKTIVQEIVEELGLDDVEVQRRLALLHIGQRDRECLLILSDSLVPEVETIVNEAIDGTELDPEVGAQFWGSYKRELFSERVIQALKRLLQAEIDVAYVKERLTFGIRNHRDGLTPGVYIGFFAGILSRLQQQAVAISHLEEGCTVDGINAMSKMALFDLGLLVEAYFHTEHMAIEKTAKLDALTDLPNYNSLREVLSLQPSVFGAENGMTMLYVGLDRFKQINETLGHAVGDEILKQVALRLKEVFHEDSLLFRMAGDVFILLRLDASSEDEALGSVLLVLTSLMSPFSIDGVNIDVSATIGIDIRDGSLTDPQSMLQSAEVAYYTAKDRQVTHAIYHCEMERSSSEQLRLLGELRRAIDNRELVLHYQPKVNLATGEIVCAEALVRWRHPERGLVPPSKFIPAAEQTSLIHPLTSWVLRNAVNRAVVWQRKGREVAVAVNLSAPNLQNADLANEIHALLEVYGLEPWRLVLEITETGMMADPNRAIDILAKVRELGVKTSIDDFGTGYSSLAYLKKLPVDEIKIDRGFIFNLADGEVDAAIVSSAIELARGMKLDVTAEGIENRRTYERLVEMKCVLAQGTFICPPMPADELEKWLDEHTVFDPDDGVSLLNQQVKDDADQ